MNDVLAKAGAQNPPKAQFAVPSSAKNSSDSESSKPTKGGKAGVLRGRSTPKTVAPETPLPQGGESRKVLSGEDVTESTKTPKATAKRGRGRPKGSKNKPKAEKAVEMEVITPPARSYEATGKTPLTPHEALVLKKKQAEFILLSGEKEEKPQKVDEIAIEKDMLSEWLAMPETKLIEWFDCDNYHLWKDEVGMTPPAHSCGKMGYYLAASSMLRKDRFMWERMVIRDGLGEWIGIDEDMLDAYVSGFFAGVGMQAHLSSLTMSRAIVDWGKKELEKLPWSQSTQFADDLHQWVDGHIHVDTQRIGGYCMTSRELFTAYKLTTGDNSLNARSFGMRASKAIQDLFSDECRRGSIRRTKNLRYTPMCSRIVKSAGWMGVKLALSELDTLRVKEELGMLTSHEAKRLEKYSNLNTTDTTKTPLF